MERRWLPFPGPHTVMCNMAVPNVPKDVIYEPHPLLKRVLLCPYLTLTENKMGVHQDILGGGWRHEAGETSQEELIR